MILGDSDFNFSQIRNRTLMMVGVVSIFSVVILAFASTIYVQNQHSTHRVATLLCIIAVAKSLRRIPSTYLSPCFN